MLIEPDVVSRLRAGIRVERLLDVAERLIEVPSPTRSGAAVADLLAQILGDDGFAGHGQSLDTDRVICLRLFRVDTRSTLPSQSSTTP